MSTAIRNPPCDGLGNNIEPERVFEADEYTFEQINAIIEREGRADGLDAALGAVAAALVAALGTLVATFGPIQARAIVDQAVARYFARLKQ